MVRDSVWDDLNLEKLDEHERFDGIFDTLADEITNADNIDPDTLKASELEELEAQIIELSRVDPVIFSEYVFRWPMHPFHREVHDLLSSNDRLVLWAPIEHGKALDIETEVPTSAGWKSLGAIEDGDFVYGSDGRGYPVVKAHAPLLNRKVYEFRFDDGGRVVSDEDHLWKAWSHWDLEKSRSPRVVSTREIVSTGVKWKTYHRWKIPVADPVRQRTRHRSIVDIQEVPRRTTRCLTVASPDGTFLVGRDYTVTHNTSTAAIARPLWEIGKNPSIRTALISNSAGQSKKSLAVIRQQIEINPRLRAVYPRLRPETRAGYSIAWHNDAIIVEREDISNRDPTIQALGIGGKIVGARLDIAIVDDVLDFMNTLSKSQRGRITHWFESHVESRATALGKIWLIGTAWHREDLMHVTAQRRGWNSKRFDGSTGELWPEFAIIDGKPQGWPKWRIEKKRETTSSLEFNRQIRNVTMSSDSEIFKGETISACFDEGTPWDPLPRPSDQFYVGVDLNVKKKEARDKTAFFIGRVDGSKKIVHRIVFETMNLGDIIFWFYYIEARFHPVLFLVENNAAQDYVVQLFEEEKIVSAFATRGMDPEAYKGLHPRVEGFTTGSDKHDPLLGIRGMTLEFEQKRWSIPEHALTRTWAEEMLSFDPADHTGDILMASWLFFSATVKYRPKRLRALTGSNRERT